MLVQLRTSVNTVYLIIIGPLSALALHVVWRKTSCKNNFLTQSMSRRWQHRYWNVYNRESTGCSLLEKDKTEINMHEHVCGYKYLFWYAVKWKIWYLLIIQVPKYFLHLHFQTRLRIGIYFYVMLIIFMRMESEVTQ